MNYAGGWRAANWRRPSRAIRVWRISDFRLIASPRQMLDAAAGEARRLGIAPLILGDAIEGEAREVGRVLAGIALSCARHGLPAAAPCVLLSGGETTVTLRGNGRGGRNSEFLLGLALALGGAPGIHALAADTDGIDGCEDNAGAFVAPDTLRRARAMRHRRRRLPGGQRCLGFLRGARRPAGDRADAHQRQ